MYYQGVVARRESSVERRKSVEFAMKLERADTGLSHVSLDYEADEFRDKMRTAAVMLAQLYQQQQKGTQSPVKRNTDRFRSMSATAASYIYPKSPDKEKPGSLPPSPSHDDRVQQKLRNEFEEIRAKVIKEMTL